MMFWVPMSGRVTLGISILSYAGTVRLGIASDSGRIPDPQAIATAFEREFSQLLDLARRPLHSDELTPSGMGSGA